MRRTLSVFPVVLLSLLVSACSQIRTSDTARTGLEQLLISDAVDKTLQKIEVPAVNGRRVFLDTQYLDGVDKGYVIGSIRQRLLNGGALMADKKEGSEITVEVFSGGIGTDNSNRFVGMPGMALPGPMPVNLPEVRLYDRSKQAGTAKISLVAYDTVSGSLVHDGGNSMAVSEDNRWSMLGMGPFLEGDVRRQLSAARRNRLIPPSRTAAVKSGTETGWR